ncbi:hypothetical protein [Pseudoalteromonas denitrificans]|uniref:hypothetical protein n=1 Tax=Pseudoalteromonas denitrificans TaxID=43656 RepID=UPI001160521D|nr:hypothetical protein [Pseudoalteromonas denitrificans]
MITILFIVVGLYSSYSNACRYRAQSIEERFENSTYVVTAWVTGIELIGFENNKKFEIENEESGENEEIISTGYEPEILSLLSIEKFKGRRKPPRNVKSGICWNGIVELKDKAIFFISKYEGEYTSFAISESNNKEYYLKSLAKIRALSN